MVAARSLWQPPAQNQGRQAALSPRQQFCTELLRRELAVGPAQGRSGSVHSGARAGNAYGSPVGAPAQSFGHDDAAARLSPDAPRFRTWRYRNELVNRMAISGTELSLRPSVRPCSASSLHHHPRDLLEPFLGTALVLTPNPARHYIHHHTTLLTPPCSLPPYSHLLTPTPLTPLTVVH